MSWKGQTTVGSDIKYKEGFEVTDDVKSAFHQNGYIFLRGLLDGEEINKLKTALENDKCLKEKSFDRSDGMGKLATYYCWNHPGNDVTGMVARNEKVAGTFEKLLGGEVYHYHTKLIQKEAFTGGAHNWHQDYGYWYHNGCLFPDMGSVFIAIDKTDKSNGCLQIVPRSHLAGRIDHVPVGDEVAADPQRMTQLLGVLPLVHCEMEAGDAVFFHGNVLHRSAQNNSPNRRWGYIIAYNRADNNPVKDHHHPKYTPLIKVPTSAIRDSEPVTSPEGKDFFLGGASSEAVAIQEIGAK